MGVQYKTVVDWDADLIDVELVNATSAPDAYKGLAKTAVKVTVGTPSNVTTIGKFIPGGIIYGVDGMGQGKPWVNTGSTAIPNWH